MSEVQMPIVGVVEVEAIEVVAVKKGEVVAGIMFELLVQFPEH